jgi:hypothetical protein
VERIGITAESCVSGLDEGQAAGLLSAVSGYGLSLVEPGAATDPATTGLAYALNRAYHAWIRTQPQLILDLWPDSGLDETQGSPPSGLRLVEPVPASPFPLGGGLDLMRTEAGASLSVEPRAHLREGA